MGGGRLREMRLAPTGGSSSGQIIDAMVQAGFERVDCRVACRFAQTRRGRSVLEDPELQRRGCSQMALLTDEQYAAGME
jgi:hypothetical protein